MTEKYKVFYLSPSHVLDAIEMHLKALSMIADTDTVIDIKQTGTRFTIEVKEDK